MKLNMGAGCLGAIIEKNMRLKNNKKYIVLK